MARPIERRTEVSEGPERTLTVYPPSRRVQVTVLANVDEALL